jgi:hypothetical protein
MGTTKKSCKLEPQQLFFQSPGMALLFIVISSNFAKYGIVASLPNFKITPGMPSGPTDFFLPIIDNCFLIMLILMVKGLPDFVGGTVKSERAKS